MLLRLIGDVLSVMSCIGYLEVVNCFVVKVKLIVVLSVEVAEVEGRLLKIC